MGACTPSSIHPYALLYLQLSRSTLACCDGCRGSGICLLSCLSHTSHSLCPPSPQVPEAGTHFPTKGRHPLPRRVYTPLSQSLTCKHVYTTINCTARRSNPTIKRQK